MKHFPLKRDTLLLFAALVLLLIALLSPAIPMKRDLHNYLIVVDVTQSMNAVDMQWKGKSLSRIAYVRKLLQETIPQLPCGSKVSLGVFSAEHVALLFMPIEVCANYEVLQDSVAHLEWRMAWRGNSRLRFGMKSASAALSSLPQPAQVVFLTDGDEAPKLNAINKLDLSEWRGGEGWLVVGIGGDEPAPIPKYDSEDRILGYWAFANEIMAPSQVQSEESIGTRDDTVASDTYDRYLSQLYEPYLKELSHEIGADYLRADQPEALAEAMRQQKPAGAEVAQVRIDWLLVLAAMSLVLAGYWPNLRPRLLILKESS
ncbi:MAG TPA: VWA domain-containing protein [Methylophilaceae bacterium]|nr:VWA domain-containing protein [Methylophilaceae bacterium]